MRRASSNGFWGSFAAADWRLSLCRPLIALGTFLGAGLPIGSARVLDFIDYGFDEVDTSSGGTPLDGYVSHQFWAETDGVWFGSQLRIKLSQGSIFQDALGETEITAGAPSAILVELQPSFEFDTYIEMNGAAPGIVGGAINLGGKPEVRFDSEGINIAWFRQPGTTQSGHLDLARLTLSEDAVGRGAVFFSTALSDGLRGYEHVAQVVKIDDGTIRFEGAPILSVPGGLFNAPQLVLDANFEPDSYMREYFNRTIEGTPVYDWILAYESTAELPFEPLTMRIDDDGSASLELEYLSDTTVETLLATRRWTVQGQALVFREIAVPEPSTVSLVVLLTLAAARASIWRVGIGRS